MLGFVNKQNCLVHYQNYSTNNKVNKLKPLPY
jgi:hypothetical protein